MVTVKVIRPFNDRENNLVLRKVGEEYSTSKERGTYLVDKGFAEIVKTPKKNQKVD